MSSGFVLAEPAIMDFQFMNAPTKAAMPVNKPRISPVPISSSPTAVSFAHQF